MQNNAKVVFTGGHAGTTALSTIDALKRKHPPLTSLYWIGARKAVEGRGAKTLESEFFPKRGVTFISLFSGRLQRKFTFWTIPSALSIPIGFIQAFVLLSKIRPKVVVSFGGFSSFPVVVTAWVQGIPVLLHEQVAGAGRASLASAFFARKIALARHESLKYFPKQKCVVIGNPISKKMESVKFKEKVGSPPSIFITGGSRGSATINTLLKSILFQLLNKYRIFHQVGLFELAKFEEIRKNLPLKLSSRYEARGSIDPGDMPSFYDRADIIIARAGANTVSEIIVAKRPAILIPLPFSYLDEQRANAKIAQGLGIAIVLEQKEATPKRLKEIIEKLFKNWEDMVRKVAHYKSPDLGAADKMISLIDEYLL